MIFRKILILASQANIPEQSLYYMSLYPLRQLHFLRILEHSRSGILRASLASQMIYPKQLQAETPQAIILVFRQQPSTTNKGAPTVCPSESTRAPHRTDVSFFLGFPFLVSISTTNTQHGKLLIWQVEPHVVQKIIHK